MLGRTAPKYLQSSDIKWNFTKFLIDREGNVVERFEPTADMAEVEEIEKKLSGVICGRRPTSCADQLARACRAAYEEQN